MKLTTEQIAKAKTAKNVEELIAIAKENGIEFTEEQAKKYFVELHKEGELADEELDNVTGGCGDDPEPNYNGYPLRRSSWRQCGSDATFQDRCDECAYFHFLPKNARVDDYDGYCTK